MKILVINGSPSGKNSITLQTVLFLQKHFKKAEFEFLHVGARIHSIEKDFSEAESALLKADLLLFAYPVYTFLVSSQLHRFIELIKEHHLDLNGKYATQISTSKHFYDTTAHQFIRDNCDDLGLKYIAGLSEDMEDLLTKKGQDQALEFFRYVRWNMKNGFCEPPRYAAGTNARMEPEVQENQDVQQEANMPEEAPSENASFSQLGDRTVSDDTEAEWMDSLSGRRIVIITDLPENTSGSSLPGMIRVFQENCGCRCDVVNIRDFPFKGGCLGCFHCAADGTCIYKDGFDVWLRNNIQASDAIIYAYTIRDHSMGARFKMFDDRQFCNGHRTVTMGKPIGYLVEGDLQDEPNLVTLMEARSQAGGNFLAGIASCGSGTKNDGPAALSAGQRSAAVQLARRTAYAIARSYDPPKNFYGVGGMKIFRDLIYQMQGMMREDHRFYKEHGFYDFPQKNKGRILGMYLVGAMMNSKALSKRVGGKMTEGMLMPYKQLLDKIPD